MSVMSNGAGLAAKESGPPLSDSSIRTNRRGNSDERSLPLTPRRHPNSNGEGGAARRLTYDATRSPTITVVQGQQVRAIALPPL